MTILTNDLLTFDELIHLTPAEHSKGRGVTTGPAHWTGAPAHDITFTAATILAPDNDDLDAYITTCTPHAHHVTQLNQQAAYLLCTLRDLELLDETQTNQIQRLSALTHAPDKPRPTTRHIPADILRSPGGPAVQAIIDCIKRANSTVPRTAPTQREEIRQVTQNLLMLAALLKIHLTERAPDDIRIANDDYRINVHHRSMLALCSIYGTHRSVQDFREINRMRLSLTVTPNAMPHLPNLKPLTLIQRAAGSSGRR